MQGAGVALPCDGDVRRETADGARDHAFLAVLGQPGYTPLVDPEDARIVGILEATSTIAMVGASPSADRPSYEVMSFLQGQGYRVLPVNPRCSGREILGARVYACLAEVPEPVDMVDVFRSSEAAGEVADEVIAEAPRKRIRALWMQIGVRDEAAAARAAAAGLQVVMDRCPKIEFVRLGVRRRGAPGGNG